MRKYRLYQVDAFTDSLFEGNPAGVVPNADGLSDVEMQRIAREMNNSETAFLLSPTDDTHDVWVRFFTPQTEVPICGHATVAAHFVRALKKGMDSGRVLQKTGAGVLPVDVERDGAGYRIVMTQGRVEFGERITGEALSLLLTALGLSENDLRKDCPVQIVSTGHSKVMVGLGETPAAHLAAPDVHLGIHGQLLLHALKPDSALLCKVSERIHCNGFYVFTLDPQKTPAVHGRMFAPAIGIAEDPVTGNANGPLGAYLVRYGLMPVSDGELCFTAMQGEAINRPGTIDVNVTVQNGLPTEVRIAGRARVVFKTTLTLDDR